MLPDRWVSANSQEQSSGGGRTLLVSIQGGGEGIVLCLHRRFLLTGILVGIASGVIKGSGMGGKQSFSGHISIFEFFPMCMHFQLKIIFK